MPIVAHGRGRGLSESEWTSLLRNHEVAQDVLRIVVTHHSDDQHLLESAGTPPSKGSVRVKPDHSFEAPLHASATQVMEQQTKRIIRRSSTLGQTTDTQNKIIARWRQGGARKGRRQTVDILPSTATQSSTETGELLTEILLKRSFGVRGTFLARHRCPLSKTRQRHVQCLPFSSRLKGCRGWHRCFRLEETAMHRQIRRR